MGRLRLVTWNADGLLTKKFEFTQFLQEMNVDVALVQETHLRPGDTVNIPNYQTYRTDRPNQDIRPSGGTAVFIRRRVAHRHIPNVAAHGMEITTIAVFYDGAELEISSLYNPPNRRLNNQHLDGFLRPGSPALIVGDLNSKHREWGCRLTNTSGRSLKNYLDTHRHVRLLAPDEPTHFPYQGHAPDILDIGLYSSPSRIPEVFAVSDLSSDHVPVIFDLPDDEAPDLPPLRPRRVNWVRYKNFLADRPRPPPPPAETPAELDLQVQDVTTILQEAIGSSSSDSPANRQPTVPQDILEEIRRRRRLRRVYQRTRCPHAKAEFNRQARLCSRLLAAHRSAQWDEFIESQAEKDFGVWKVARSLRGEKKTIRPLHGQRGLAYSPEARAEAFADSLEDQFSPHADVYDDDHCEMVETFVEEYEPDEDDPLPPVSTHEVTDLIRRLRPKKSPGPDALGTPAMKNLPDWVVIFITAIFSSCLRLGYFPTTWKIAKVILIPKPGKDPLFPENHRPISLLPVLSKMLERILLARFPEDFFTSIRTEQFGFRKGHSTVLQLRRVLNSLTSAMENKQHSTSVLIDVSKAFDRVWHEGLLYKLSSSPLPGKMFKILRSYLHQRTFHVSVGDKTSTSRPIQAGVPQGSVLGPILYLWYTNDMPLAPRVQLSLYADDALLTASSANVRMSKTYIQRQLDLLHPWLTKWRIKVNADKCEFIIFTKSRQDDGQPLTLDGGRIPKKNVVKYLGVLLDNRLTMSPHVERLCSLATAAQDSLGPLFRSTKLPMKTKVLLYTALLRPVLTYAAPAWYHLTCRTSRRKLLTVQSRSLRRATDSPWYVRNAVIRDSIDVPTIRIFVDRQTATFNTAAETSEWEHIRRLAAEDVPQLRPNMID